MKCYIKHSNLESLKKTDNIRMSVQIKVGRNRSIIHKTKLRASKEDLECFNLDGTLKSRVKRPSALALYPHIMEEFSKCSAVYSKLLERGIKEEEITTDLFNKEFETEVSATKIESKQHFFQQKAKIKLQRNELLLFGNRYVYYYSTKFQNKVVVNHLSKTIQAKRDLLDLSVQEKWLKSVAKKHIAERAATLSEALLLPYNKLFIRSPKRKWGNCSAEKNISINWRVIKAPEFVFDYVIIHELCHTVIMKHTVRFQTLLRSHCPSYDAAQSWLDKYGNSL